MERHSGDAANVWSVLGGLVRHPWQRIVLRWNWKSATMSALLRGLLFLIATLHWKGHGSRFAAFATESVWACLSAGIYGTLAQALRCAQPQWAVVMLLALVFPAVFQVWEYASHALAGSAVFHAGLIVSAVVSGVSALFNLYIMRRGAMLAHEGTSFVSDLKRIPRLLLGFVVDAARMPLRSVPQEGKR